MRVLKSQMRVIKEPNEGPKGVNLSHLSEMTHLVAVVGLFDPKGSYFIPKLLHR